MCTCWKSLRTGRGRVSLADRSGRSSHSSNGRGIALVVHVDRCGVDAGRVSRLAVVGLVCVHSVPPRPRRPSPYWPREHAGATGFSLNETSPFSPTVPSWWHARLRSRTCHRQALTTHAIASRHCPLDIPGTDIRSAVIVFGDPSVYLSNPAFQVPALLIARGTTGRTRGCTACR